MFVPSPYGIISSVGLCYMYDTTGSWRYFQTREVEEVSSLITPGRVEAQTAPTEPGKGGSIETPAGLTGTHVLLIVLTSALALAGLAAAYIFMRKSGESNR